MNDFLNIVLVSDNVKKFDQAWEQTLMGLESEPEEDLLEGLTPSAVGEVDSLAKCFGAFFISFRSGSPRKAEELLEVDSYCHRRSAGPAATFSHSLKRKKAG